MNIILLKNDVIGNEREMLEHLERLRDLNEKCRYTYKDNPLLGKMLIISDLQKPPLEPVPIYREDLGV